MKFVLKILLLNIFYFIAVSFVHSQEIHQEKNNLYSTGELHKIVEVKARSKINIKSAAILRGKITITTSEKNEVSIKYFKKAKTNNKSKAIDYIDLIAVSLVQIPGGINLELRAPNPAPWQDMEMGMVEITMIIPEFCEVEIESDYFDITALGPFRKFIVPSSLGRLDIEYVTEQLELVTSNRRVTIKNISGDINVTTSNSTLIARDINSPENKASFRNNGGDIKVDGITGGLHVKNSYGRIDIKQFKLTDERSYIRGSYGPIMVAIKEINDGYLLISNRYEDIEVEVPENISAFFSLAVEEEGKIEVSNMIFKPELVQENRLNLITGDGKAIINSSLRGKGNIFVRGISEGD